MRQPMFTPETLQTAVKVAGAEALRKAAASQKRNRDAVLRKMGLKPRRATDFQKD